MHVDVLKIYYLLMPVTGSTTSIRVLLFTSRVHAWIIGSIMATTCYSTVTVAKIEDLAEILKELGKHIF